MRGIRSRILRTLESAAPNALLPLPAALPEKCHLKERAPSHLPAGAEAVPELPTVSDAGGDGHSDKENFSSEANPRKAKKMKVSSEDRAAEAVLCYRRPELESDLLAAYTQALEKTAKRHPAYDEDDDDIAAELDMHSFTQSPILSRAVAPLS